MGIDAEDVGAGAAGRNGGFILAGMADFYHDEVKLLGHEYTKKRYLETLEELESMYKEFPDCTRRCGSLRLAASKEELKDCRL